MNRGEYSQNKAKVLLIIFRITAIHWISVHTMGC